MLLLRGMRWLLLMIVLTGCAPVEVYFCPQDQCAHRLTEMLADAHDSIYFMTYALTDEQIASMLVQQSARLDVMGIMEWQRRNNKGNKMGYLQQQGVAVQGDDNPAIMHHKVFIIDKKTVVTGSYNPTKNGNERNNENMVVIQDKKIAARYLEEFARLWHG